MPSAYNTGFLVVIFFGCVICLSSENWLSFWVGMEICSLFFSAILASSHSGGFLSWIAAWNYFVYQCLGSIMILYSTLIENESIGIGSIVLLAGVILKIGLFPFQGWVIFIMENASMVVILTLSTIQKLPPLIILSFLNEGGESVYWITSLSVIWVSVTCVNSLSLKNILALSSILSSSWMIFAILCSWEEFTWFFLTYSTYLLLLMFSLWSFTISTGSVTCLCTNPRSTSLGQVGVFILACLAGLPPFGPFWAKVSVVSSLISSGHLCVAIIILLGSMVLLVSYFTLLCSLYFVVKSWNSYPPILSFGLIMQGLALLIAGAYPLLGVV